MIEQQHVVYVVIVLSFLAAPDAFSRLLHRKVVVDRKHLCGILLCYSETEFYDYGVDAAALTVGVESRPVPRQIRDQRLGELPPAIGLDQEESVEAQVPPKAPPGLGTKLVHLAPTARVEPIPS